MTTHRTTTTARDGASISWSRSGEGPPVLLVHGITESSASWSPIVDRLQLDHEVVAMDLRGHGASGEAADYGLEAMAGDVATVLSASGLDRPHLVGHSLGGVVVSAAGAVLPVASVTNVDQPLRLGAFRDQLGAIEGMLRDPEVFPVVIAGMFAEMAGSLLSASEQARLEELRRADQTVVLGVWKLILESPLEEIEASVDQSLSGYRAAAVPYLSLFGDDPGDEYVRWLTSRIPSATVEAWPGHGHYLHLVDPDRFVERLESFWA